MPIRCCNGCVPPKRSSTCHGTCPNYIKEKAEHDALMEKESKKRSINQGLNEQTSRAVHKAYKNGR